MPAYAPDQLRHIWLKDHIQFLQESLDDSLAGHWGGVMTGTHHRSSSRRCLVGMGSGEQRDCILTSIWLTVCRTSFSFWQHGRGIHFSLKNPKLWKHLLTDALLSFKFADPDSLQLLQLQGRIGPAGAAAQCCDNGLGSLLEVF